MTHKEKILMSLRRAGSRGACTEELSNEWHIRRVAARIKDLRNDGKSIATLRCGDHGDARYLLVTWRREQPPIPEPDFDSMAAEIREREPEREPPDPIETGPVQELPEPPDEVYGGPPDQEPPGEDREDAFHTSAIWGDDGADFGHDSAVDRALGEGIG